MPPKINKRILENKASLSLLKKKKRIDNVKAIDIDCLKYFERSRMRDRDGEKSE